MRRSSLNTCIILCTSLLLYLQSRKRNIHERFSFTCLPILGSDPTLCHNCSDCTYNTSLLLSVLLLSIVYRRASTTTRALLLVSHYLNADKPEIPLLLVTITMIYYCYYSMFNCSILIESFFVASY